MRLRRPSLTEAIVAALCGLWVALFLATTPGWALLAAIATAGLVLLMPQRPVIAGAAVGALHLALALSVSAQESPAGIAPVMVAVYSLGRYAAFRPSIAVAALFPVGAWVEAGDIGTVVFASLLTTAVFCFGVIVRRRAGDAERQGMLVASLQATDTSGLADRVIADERARLGGQALAILRESVAAMARDAGAAMTDLDLTRIEAVTAGGRQAVAELRWLLGLLRSEPPRDRPTAPARRWHWVPDAAAAALLMALGTFEAVWMGGGAPSTWLVALGLPLCVAVRRRFTRAACGIAAGLVGVAVLTSTAPLATAVLSLAALAWSAGVVSRPTTWMAFGLAGASMTTWVALASPDNLPVTLGLLGLPAFAGHEWAAHDRRGRDAAARAEVLRTDLEMRIDRARREERLRLARELHDVTSHAVGVMVLQASAAAALRERDPVAARQALSTVGTTADQALTELMMMFELLNSGAIGSPGLADSVGESLTALVERLRSTGLDITLEFGTIPRPLHDTVYRIVQESLTNVVRHSHARSVRVTVTSDHLALSVSVRDDGPEPVAETEAATGRFGLTGLAERVDAAGGTFRAGRDGRGFVVEATLPLTPAVRS